MESAELVLWKIMKRARGETLRWRPALVCPECRGVPRAPVTGPCGHAWCAPCALEAARCACGARAPADGTPDVLARRLVDVMFARQRDAAGEAARAEMLHTLGDARTAAAVCKKALKLDPRNVQLRLTLAKVYVQSRDYPHAREQVEAVMSIDPRMHEAHYIHALVLKALNQRDAALRSFLMACMLGRDLSDVRHHMIELIEMALAKAKSSHRLVRGMRLALRTGMKQCNEHQGEALQPPDDDTVDPAELECSVCSFVYLQPVATPCGHTFCRICVQRCLDHNLSCPLCNAPLECLRRGDPLQESTFVSAIAARLPPELKCRVAEKSDMLPLIVCTIGFPSVPCLLLIKMGRNLLMVRRCLESGSRRFGMIGCRFGGEMEPPLPSGWRSTEYGTVLEIRDCVTRPDGCLLLSTVGESRFRVVARDELDGYDVARVEPVRDTVDDGGRVAVGREYTSVRSKVLLWMHLMKRSTRDELDNSFGPMPPEDLEWDGDGPAWVWWILAALPLKLQIKRLFLGTPDLTLRLRIIEKTLNRIIGSICDNLTSSYSKLMAESEYMRQVSSHLGQEVEAFDRIEDPHEGDFTI